MSSEMQEFQDLTNVKDTEKDLLSHQNDEQSDIRELRKKNIEWSKKIDTIKQVVWNTSGSELLATQQTQELDSHGQSHDHEVGKVTSSAQKCLCGGINDLMNPDYFTDFLKASGESTDRPRPSYTLLRWSNDVASSSKRWSRWEWKASSSSRVTSFVGDFAGLKDLTNIRINSNRGTNDANWDSPNSQTRDIITANAMKWSGGIQDLWPVSRWFSEEWSSNSKLPTRKPQIIKLASN